MLDGDSKKDITQQFLSKHKNLVFLPTNDYPEKLVYDSLKALDDSDAFWDNDVGGYSKQQCFDGYTDSELNDATIKRWFKDQRSKHGKRYSSLFSQALNSLSENEKVGFISCFSAAFDYVKQNRL